MCRCHEIDDKDIMIGSDLAEIPHKGFVLGADEVHLFLTKDQDTGKVYLNARYDWDGYSFGPSAEIEYCPFCGRHLKREEAPEY